MNYYLARDGQSYGPYPQETFPSMLQQGQVVPQDLVCPEGGSDWVELSTLPALTGATPPAPGGVAMPTPVASNKLRISGQSGVSSAPHMASSATASTAMPSQAYPAASYPQQKTGLLEKTAGAWGLLKIVGYGAAILFVVVSVIAGYFVSQREKKEIAKLQTQPGWKAFTAGNSQIEGESDNEGYGATPQAQVLAKGLATATETIQRMSFEIDKSPRYRGRSKLGRVVSAADAANAGKGHFQIYIDMRDDRILVLIHVPEFSRYKGDARQSMTEMCWETANLLIGEAMKARENPAPAKQTTSAAGATGRPRPGRRPPAGAPQASSPAAEAPPAAVQPKEPPMERTLIVGVRGKTDYECVYLGKLTGKEDAPTPVPVKKNVPSHQMLVKWFGPEKPSSD